MFFDLRFRLFYSIFILLLNFVFSASSWAIVLEAIYGDDDRQEAHLWKGTEVFEWTRATAAMVDKKNIQRNWFFGSRYEFKNVKTLNKDSNVCADERFAKQLSPAKCTGVLVGEDLLLTAGHCIEDAKDCKKYRWVFDVKETPTGGIEKKFHQSLVFKCKKIVKRDYDFGKKVDFSLIQLDKKVSGRAPVKFRQNGNMSDAADLFIIGHPSGLPLKVANNSRPIDNTHENYFIADLDAFEGNSGSPVIDRSTGLLEGILVAGSRDYYLDPINQCQRYFKCEDNTCGGEEVTRIINVFPYLHL
jgi:V8-like Glu-specific endopeptidase